MDQSTGVALIAPVLILSIIWLLKKPKKIVPPFPPGPRGLPIVGYLPFLRENLHLQFAELARQYGPIYKFKLGNKLCMVITSPSLVKQVVRDHDAVFANRDSPIAALIASYGGNDIVWTDYDSHWRMMRKIFSREMLSNTNVEGTCYMRRQEVRKALRDVYYAKVGTPVDVGRTTFFIELNVIISMIWGSTIRGEKRDEVVREYWSVVSKLVDLMGKPNVSDYFPILARLDVQGVEKKMKGYVQCVDRIVDGVIKERMEMDAWKLRDDGNKDFLQTLLDLKDSDGETSINMTELRALLMDAVVGGTDTSATIIQWVMAELFKNEEKMEKVKEELTNLIGLDRVVEESDLPKLRYLNAVIKETLRLHPPVPLLLPRRPSKSCVVGGYTIPQKTCVFLNIWSIQRDPTLWDNPFEFCPERFLNAMENWDFSGNNFRYLPFGSGRRLCAGVAVAERTMMYILASLLHSFEWRLPEGEEIDMSEKLGLVLRKSVPFVAIPTPRLCSLDLYG